MLIHSKLKSLLFVFICYCLAFPSQDEPLRVPGAVQSFLGAEPGPQWVSAGTAARVPNKFNKLCVAGP